MTLPPGPTEHVSSDTSQLSPLDPKEVIVRYVRSSEWLLWDDDGRPALTILGIPEKDLRGRGGRSVSVTGCMQVNNDFLAWRATFINKQPEWQDDPVYAFAEVERLTGIHDTKRRPELSVCADPIQDWLGPNESHASIVRTSANMERAKNPKTRNEVLAWGPLQQRIAAAFSDIRHCSGLPVKKLCEDAP